MGYLNKFKLLHESQPGFRHKHSCQTALVKLIDQWKACIDNGDIVGTLFIDFRKAFDVVDHQILIKKKLHVYKFNLQIYPTKKETHTVTFSHSVYLFWIKLFNQLNRDYWSVCNETSV